jgi:predicted RNA-binding protein with RPS1 domain
VQICRAGGLVHIADFDERVEREQAREGDVVRVKVLEVDRQGASACRCGRGGLRPPRIVNRG